MGSFVSKQAVKVEIDERPGEWIMIKPRMSQGDRTVLQDRVLKVETAGKELTAEVRVGTWQQSLLELMIVGWNLLDDAGNPVPYKRELIADFDPDDPLVDEVLGEIAARNPTSSAQSATTG